MINRLWIFLLAPVCCWSQILTGTIVDASANQPLETVSVYFDNTTVGTTTNENGEFSITYTDAIQSSLVISYLGFEKIIINDYRDKEHIAIALKPSSIALDEVNLDYDDGLTRKQKLRLFRKEFLGTSKIAKSCKILNEDDLILRYDKENRVLSASAKAPIKIENKALQYEIDYDIIDFELSFKYANIPTNSFTKNRLTYYGTTFYKDLKKSNKKSTIKKRERAFKGSVQHFMRALFNENLKGEGYWIFYGRFRVNEWAYFTVGDLEDSSFKQVTLNKKVTILYDKDIQSSIEVNTDKFYVDRFGNYAPIVGVFFNGYMGSQRVGDSVPSDYNLDSDSQIVNDDFLEGNWNVVSVEKSSKEPPFSLMVDSFKNAQFTFNSDKTFNLQTTAANSFFQMLTSAINQSTWSLSKINENSLVSIANGENIQMEIFVSVDGSDVFFTIGKQGEPSYFLLKVVKA
ncbi:carboxypeptidase-like regulatory domain-containing protein [Winogradskyella sp.]|uniref:carboxypeptidase-like regulatory domain-containing protein n=1 Tax=Winogradskyella sp. TaxID=1883156 RepID=UPI0026391FBE|nr:carboxypeptidase-like regulatory domain-containing protein [Winogradskyella sp.]